MRKILNNSYVKWALVGFSVIALSLLLYFFMLRIDKVLKTIGKFLYILKPLFYGIIIAFLLTQIYKRFVQFYYF